MSSRLPGPPGPQPPEPPRTPLAWLKTWFGRRLARYLSSEPPKVILPAAMDQLAAAADCLQPGDVILVEGNSRFSTGIKFLTQSTWSHAALYVGEAALADRPEGQLPDGRRACVIEADLVDGVRAVSLDLYAGLPLRICRAVSLSPSDAQTVVRHAVGRLGHKYDLQHIFDLMRWLLPAPPIPARFRRRLLTLGSGDPTRAICSMLVAEALQAVRYPILPRIERVRRVDGPDVVDMASEVLHLRHASLYVPRDFDLSPYFEIIKPTLARGFDHRELVWGDDLVDADPLTTEGTVRPAAAGHAANDEPRPEQPAAAKTGLADGAWAGSTPPGPGFRGGRHRVDDAVDISVNAERPTRTAGKDSGPTAASATPRHSSAAAATPATEATDARSPKPPSRPRGLLARLVGR